MEVVINELMYSNEPIGYRFTFNGLNTSCGAFDVPRSISDNFGILASKLGKFKKGRTLTGKVVGTVVQFGQDSNVIEIDDMQTGKKELSKMMKKYAQKEDILKVITGDFKSICKKDILRELERNGIEVPFSDEIEYDEESLCMSCRFLGGMGAWSGDEDICDASVLDYKVCKKLDKVVKEFNKKYHTDAYWCSGEKAWVYIYIR